MGIEYYAFALFIAGLICIVAILCKVLFTGVKRQYKLLDEKETKLLQLYQTVESIMEEWNDQVRAAMDEIKEYESRVTARAVSYAKPPPEPVKRAPDERPQRTEIADSSRLKAATEVLERAERMIKNSAEAKSVTPVKSDNGMVFQRLFDETTGDAAESAADQQGKPARRDSILALAKDGKTITQIAQELGITQNEVKLVIGLGAGAKRA